MKKNLYSLEDARKKKNTKYRGDKFTSRGGNNKAINRATKNVRSTPVKILKKIFIYLQVLIVVALIAWFMGRKTV